MRIRNIKKKHVAIVGAGAVPLAGGGVYWTMGNEALVVFGGVGLMIGGLLLAFNIIASVASEDD